MAHRPTPEQLMALTVLSRQARWSDIEAMVEDQIAQAVVTIVANTDLALIHERRGYIKALQEFQSLARTAPETLKKQGLTASL